MQTSLLLLHLFSVSPASELALTQDLFQMPVGLSDYFAHEAVTPGGQGLYLVQPYNPEA